MLLKKPYQYFILFVMLCGLTSLTAQRQVIPLLEGWKFHLGHAWDIKKDFGFGTGTTLQLAKLEPAPYGGHGIPATLMKFDDTHWQLVDVPHDWSVGLSYDTLQNPKMGNRYGYKPVGREYPETSIGWYRKEVLLPESDESRKIVLRFEGVFRNCMVWVNGFLMGRNWGGYSGFEMDISDYLSYGSKNIITVRVDASLHEGWFYEGAGIHKEVFLIKSDRLHIDNYKPYITTHLLPDGTAEVKVKTKIFNEESGSVITSLTTEIYDDRTGEVLATQTTNDQQIADQHLFHQRFVLHKPILWSLDKPERYTLISQLKKGTKFVDKVRTRFGVRDIHFDADRGFFLNGKRTQIKGACIHQNFAGVGSGIPEPMHYYRLRLLKEMGVNAVRSHYPFSPSMLNACDSLGVFVMQETRATGSTKESLYQLSTMIQRDRNHPAIILWSMANEEGGTQRHIIGRRYMRKMVALTHQLDPYRKVTAGVNAWGSKVDVGFAQEIDVMGFNYSLSFIDQYHKDHPRQPIIGTEVSNATVTRGLYTLGEDGAAVKGGIGGYYNPRGTYRRHKKFKGHIPANDPRTNSGAYTSMAFYAKRPYLAGSFLWTGFDYNGETWPSDHPNNSSQFGAMDLAGFPKDLYYYYQSWWTDKPVMHIANHWNWQGHEGENIPILIHSNADEVNLFLNDEKIATQTMRSFGYLLFDVKYAKGILKAVGYKNGQKVSQDIVRTATHPYTIRLIPDKKTIIADGKDLVFVRGTIVDKRGIPVPVADDLIEFEVQGDATILGTHNGNPSSLELDNGSKRKAFNGKLLVIIKAGHQKGTITLNAFAKGLQQATIIFEAQ